ncbi:PHD finger protein 3-like isoform X1 [Acipenser ruthenus]|uniref:PHD finger protein 3-like isoform X1 n=3 Tax=Acipenser ruthenus TaxID=7906 RepID=UPI0027410AB5|nr:PHD finger protein 3-like isoform X1 [Acipenser ruthenus]XP_058879906.1 PHD finger protein 3-like isoform X1 [Acipenser ruthenus]
MDIGETFNHLIPSDQLDDTLLLGPNLESEVGDEFGTGHNLEDSLKNMLSDKDPMLGSASSQFHLLDNDDTNFQTTGSTVVGLEDIMYEGELKESGHDIIEEEDLMLPGKSQRGRSVNAALQSPRKSPRLMAQEPVRSLRQSTLARRCSPSNTLKKSPAKGDPGRRGEQKQQENLTGQDESESCSQESGLHSVQQIIATGVSAMNPAAVAPKKEDTVEDFNSGLKVEEQSCRSHMTDTNMAQTNEDSSICQIHDTDKKISREQDNELFETSISENAPNTAIHTEGNICEVKGKASEMQINILGSSELGPCINPNEVQEGPNMLLRNCKVEDRTKKNIPDKSAIEPENVRDQIDAQTLRYSSVERIGPDKSHGVNETQQHADTNAEERLHPSKGRKNQESRSKLDQKYPIKKLLKSKEVHSTLKQHHKLLPKLQAELLMEQKFAQQRKARIDIPNYQGPKQKQPLTAIKRKADDPKMHQQQEAAKLQKTEGSSQDVKSKIGAKTHPKQAHMLQPSMSLKSPESGRPANRTLAIGVVKDRFKSQQQTTQFPHMSQKHHVALSKSSFIQKDELEEDDGEKHNLKKNEKGLHRQRRSSRSLSLNEPPLFIPDNVPAVKKDASEDGDSNDNEVMWDHSKNCVFCKKPHSNRFMVGCGRCDDWFHGDCVGLGLAQAQQMEQEDQEYVCLKCCAEEDKGVKSSAQNPCAKQQPSSLHHSKPEHQESRPAVKHEKLGQSASSSTGVCNLNLGTSEKTKQSDDIRKYKVKIFRKESTEGISSESREMENRKMQTVGRIRRPSGDWMGHGDSEPKPGISERQDIKKRQIEKSPFSLLSSSKKPSVEQIRQNVRESLKDILIKRLSESNLKISTDRAAKVALKTERELFSFFRDTDTKYKSKYRSLMFNLKDAKNNVLFKRVLKGEISPDHLIRMSPEELASKELAAWRQRENRHTIEMIEKEQREVERRPITKITHKGEIEIENQEQVKEPEVMEVEEEPVPKPVEEPEEVTEEADSESTKDTTSQHKKHLFDLNCKICTGRMAPPVDDVPSKIVKVATTVIRRQSNIEEETLVNTVPTYSEVLSFSAQDEKDEKKTVSPSASFCAEGRFNAYDNVIDEAAFVGRLESLWKGFINMPSVAKFVIKAYPVSGILDHLTEDLPDSIQVGGRISPQMVWDYVEKIRASGTKEVCLIRFCPVTEEDQISYTLLYAYFSSRKRYGVVANNMKQVKDMYLIPLASSEKVPHHLLSFDGPGLEARRPNLLLGLIIRQRVKRDFVAVLPVDVPETASDASLPEKKSKTDLSNDAEAAADEEKTLFNSLAPALPKHHNKPQQSSEDEEEESKEPTTVVENVSQEPTKPLRFLPGVLVGGENQTSSLDLASKPLDVDDILQSLLGTTDKVPEKQNTLNAGTVLCSTSNKSPALNTPRPDRFIIKRREIKVVKSEHSLQESTSPTDRFKLRDDVDLENSRATSSVSLKDKPQDISTESFLANISPVKTEEENKGIPQHNTEQQMNDQQKVEKESKGSSYLEQASNGSVCPVTVSCTFGEDNISPVTSKSLFLIPKRDPRQAVGRTSTDSFHDGDGNKNVNTKESTFTIENTLSERKAHSIPRDQSQGYVLPNVLNTNIQCSSVQTGTEQQRFSYQQGTKYLHVNEEIQNINTIPSFRRGPDFSLSSQGLIPGPVPGHFPQAGFPAHHIPPDHISGPGFHFQRMPNSDFPSQNNTVSNFQPQPPQIPPLFSFPRGPPPVFHPSESEVQNHGMPWPPPVSFPPSFPPHHTGLAPSGPQLSYDSRYGVSSKPHMIAKDKGPERRYSDPWDRQPQHAEKRDRSEHQSRQRYYSESYHERKGRHRERDYERDRGKYGERHSEKDGPRERSRSGDEKDRERRRSQEERHRGKDRDRHGAERPRDRHRSEEYSSRSDKEREKTKERDKDKHKKDADYEKGSKDTKSKDEKHL